VSGPEAQGTLEADLAAWGKVIVLETTGRRSGQLRRVAIGYVQVDEGWLVAASSEATGWARNLTTEPRCHVEHDGVRRACTARPLHGPERDAAIVGLILKYGTPAEQLGAGPAFRLEPD
jgi:deazaflavin-dependent oxidoreductase (nitroreductase family)